MTIKIIKMDPNSQRDFVVDWTSFLATDPGDVLFTAVWSADPGITILGGPFAPSTTASLATAWLTGGAAGNNYRITCRATTLRGRIIDYSFIIGSSSG